ncbi:MAG: hypothetical protein IIU48_05645 [Prevotella sp.]|nr:hypothetical protein [Prevotella sp.]
MNRIILLVCLLLANMSAWANNELKEDFETGMPTSAPSVETQVTLASGTWRIKGVYGKKDNNSLRATMNASGGYLITPVLCQPGARKRYIYKWCIFLMRVYKLLKIHTIYKNNIRAY